MPNMSDKNNGVFEEILYRNKPYPTNQQTYTLHPQQRSQALIQQAMRDIGNRFKELEESNDFGAIISLSNQMRRLIPNFGQYDVDMPVKAIHYRTDEQWLPTYPELFLSNPLLITNTHRESVSLFKALKYELQTADQVYFMVSFVRWSGLQLLLSAIDQFSSMNPSKKIKILTSTYLNITEPKALRRLLEIPSIETKVFDSGNVSFHTKAYIFERVSNLNTVIIGSSNLTYSALNTGHEWNVKLPGEMYNTIYHKASTAFQHYWDDPKAIPLSEALVQDYETHHGQRTAKAIDPYFFTQQTELIASASEVVEEKQNIIPNKMQIEALDALSITRQNGHRKAVVIAATGTGKTYLSAFDVHSLGANRMLFLAHRDEILVSSQRTFAKVFGNEENMGKLSGTEKSYSKPYLFSTVQTLSRDDVLNQFAQDYFDYIIIDEFHHAEAATYRKILDHFQPKFLLGLTATPERMDGKDVLALCDNNVVYEIRLRDALEEGLLTPFRYFGLSDPTVDYAEIDLQQNGQFVENELVRALNVHERVEYVIGMIHKFGHDGIFLKGLGFCASVEHAQYMSNEFNDRGLVSAYLTGQDTPERRQEIIARLESDKDSLQIIFTVNIFNEGVDIPKVNLVLFLRPTESATVFIQQLGRGLRKVDGKEYVTILDFIGNYNKSFIVPLALSGQHNHKAFDRDSLRVAIETEFADLPEGCFVELEEISRRQILEKIEDIRMDQDLLLMDLYNQFRRELGYSPEINDFLYSESAPSLHFFISKYGSWVQTKKKMKDINELDENLLNDVERLQIIQRIEKMLPVKWPYDLCVLTVALVKGTVSVQDVIAQLQFRFAINLSEEDHEKKILRAMEKLAEAQNKHKWSFGELRDGLFILSEPVKKSCNEKSFKNYLIERLEYGLAEFRRVYRPHIFFGSNKNVVLYQNYTRNDLIFLFESKDQEGSWREGVSRVGDQYLLFINLNKGKKVADHLMYHDYFVDQQNFHWQSQNATSHESPRGQEYIHHKDKGIKIHLFVRKYEKMHSVVLPFTYLGEVDYVKSHGDKPMSITWKLHHEIPEFLYSDFIR
jgi:superfamily II DNA or RNA helicase/HKD family nuclease